MPVKKAQGNPAWAKDASGKGKSGNPNGRPKSGTALSDEIRKLIEEIDITGKTQKSNKRIFAEGLFKLAVNGDSRAYSLILNHLEPKSIFDPDGEGKPAWFTLSFGKEGGE